MRASDPKAALLYDEACRSVRTLQYLNETSCEIVSTVGSVWAPARPLEGPWKWRNRFHRAWLCLTGRAEAVQWF